MEIQKVKKKKSKSHTANDQNGNTIKPTLELDGGWWIPDNSFVNCDDHQKEETNNAFSKLKTKSIASLELSVKSEILPKSNITIQTEETTNIQPLERDSSNTISRILEELPTSKESKYAWIQQSFSNIWSKGKSGSRISPELSSHIKRNQITSRKKPSINHPDFSRFFAWTRFKMAVKRGQEGSNSFNIQEKDFLTRDWILANKDQNRRKSNEDNLKTLCETKDLLIGSFIDEFAGTNELLEWYRMLRKKTSTNYQTLKSYEIYLKRIRKTAANITKLCNQLEKKSIQNIVRKYKKSDRKGFLKKSNEVKEEISKFIDNANNIITKFESKDQKFFRGKLDKIILLVSTLKNSYYLNIEEAVEELQSPVVDVFYQENKKVKLFMKHEFGLNYPENPRETKHNVSTDNISEIWRSDGYPMHSKDVSASDFDLMKKSKPQFIAISLTEIDDAPPSPNVCHSLSSLNYVPERGNNQVKLETDWNELTKMIATEYEDISDNTQQDQITASELRELFPSYNYKEEDENKVVNLFLRSTPISNNSSSADFFQENPESEIIPSTTFENVVTELRNWSQKKMNSFIRLSKRFNILRDIE